MMKIKYLLIPITMLSFAFSGSVFADKPESKGDSDAHWKNSNRQSDEYSKKGKERAEERHELKKKKHQEKTEKQSKQKKDKHSDEYRREHDKDRNDDQYNDRQSKRYENRENTETISKNPVDEIIDQNVDNVKSTVDAAQRKMNEMIDDKTKALTEGVNARSELPKEEKPWWELSRE
ncbi:MAG: hypothetical protein RQ733_12695 [Methyloprofundus sp.]|nr:hypothetical protein [Methyloprofundus sp.]MDT8426818.1 hypothetical protein [Methyloprofundus sp.]